MPLTVNFFCSKTSTSPPPHTPTHPSDLTPVLKICLLIMYPKLEQNRRKPITEFNSVELLTLLYLSLIKIMKKTGTNKNILKIKTPIER